MATKFSEFVDGNLTRTTDVIAGLRGGTNTKTTMTSGLNDTDGNRLVGWVSAGASAVNYLQLESSTTGNAPTLKTAGSDAQIPMTFETEGAADITFTPNGGKVIANTVGAFSLPTGTTAQQPASPSNGDFRFNTTKGNLEYYDSSSGSWVDVGSGAGPVNSVTGTANEVDVDNSDPANPEVSLSSTLVAPGTVTVNDLLDVNNLTDSASVLVAEFEGNRATPTNGDEAYLSLKLSDSVGNQDEFARLTWEAATATSAAEDGAFKIDVIRGGALEETAIFNTNQIVLNESGADRDFRVEGSGEPNALFLQGSDGFLGLGTSNPQAKIEALGSGAAEPSADWFTSATFGISFLDDQTQTAQLTAFAGNTASERPLNYGRRSRDTLDAPAAVQSSDLLYSLIASGYDGTNFQQGASFDFIVDDTVSGGAVPTGVRIQTGDSFGSRATAFEIDSDGASTFNGSVTLNADPASALEAATKQYVDAQSAAREWKDSAVAATTANLAGYTYDNGTAGVGATLTAGSNGAFSVDGQSPSLNDRILVKDQSTAAQNGIYTLTQVGDGSNPAILTRATDHDEPSEMEAGVAIAVDTGTVNAQTLWLQTSSVSTVGTDAVDFTQFGNSGDVVGPSSSSDNTVARFDGTSGALIQDSSVTIDDSDVVSGATQLNVDNLRLDGNTLSSTDTNGDVNLTPDGTGTVVVGTDLDVDNLNLDGNTIISTDTNGDINLTPDGTGKNVLANAQVTALTASHHVVADANKDLSSTIPTATVATDDKVLIQDTNDSDNAKTVTAQSIADLAPSSSGGFVLIDSASASSSATIEFTTGIDSTYFAFRLVFTALVPQDDDVDLEMRFSDDGGSTWTQSAGAYYWAVWTTFSDTTATNQENSTNSGETSAQLINGGTGGSLGNNTNENGSGEVIIYNPAGGDLVKYNAQCSYEDQAGNAARNVVGGHIRAATNAIDGIQLFLSSGNIVSGEFKLYGQLAT